MKKIDNMKQKRPIIFVTVSMGGGGTERVISILANYYCNMNIPVTILMIAEHRVAYELDKRIQVVNVSETTGGSLIRRIKRVISLRKYFKNNSNAEIIAMGTVTAMFSLLAKIGLKCTVVISERNDPNRLNHKPISKPIRLLRNFLYRGAKAIVLQTEDVKACFPNYLVKKSVVIPNPISESLPEVYINTNREKTVITAGRLTEQKNHKLLIDAFCKFFEFHPEYRLEIYGKGEMEEELKAYVQILGMTEYISICGFCEDLYTKLQTSGIYVSSSNWEGISNSLIEALAIGIPTIATDCPVGGSRMFIQNMENGILIKINDENALIDGLLKIAENFDFASHISANAIKIRELLSVEKIAALWQQTFVKGAKINEEDGNIH